VRQRRESEVLVSPQGRAALGAALLGSAEAREWRRSSLKAVRVGVAHLVQGENATAVSPRSEWDLGVLRNHSGHDVHRTPTKSDAPLRSTLPRQRRVIGSVMRPTVPIGLNLRP